MYKLDTHKIVEYVFDNRERVTNGFYVDIMILLKNHHVYGDNAGEIHKFLIENEDNTIVKEEILEKFFKNEFSHFGWFLEVLELMIYIF